jgi:predicted GIY-YIG superfamily endonuclease
MTGIYKLIHKQTGYYYIGSSVNIKQRFQTHMSNFRANRNTRRLQSLYAHSTEFELIVLEECRKCDLKKKEEKYLKRLVKIDPLCVNYTASGTKGNRGRKKSTLHKQNLSASMIGKNGTARLNKVTEFISPDGVLYAVVSIKPFAEKMGLSQSSLNAVANGKQKHYLGWRLSTTSLDECSQLPEELRTNITLISPEGTAITVTSINRFEEENNIFVYRDIKTSAKGCGVDEWGRGWYVMGEVPSYRFVNIKTKETIDNVISPATLAKKLGSTPSMFRKLVTGNRKKTHSGWTVQQYQTTKP